MIWNKLWQTYLELNIYETGSTDPQIILRQKRATRIYIFLFAWIMILAAMIAGLHVRRITEFQYSPSQSQFTKLTEKYSSKVTCPCATIGIAYETFVHTRVNFHPVCSSAFVTSAWMDTILEKNNTFSSVTYDIRYNLKLFWEIIAGFCSISNNTWHDAVRSFGAQRIFSPVAIVEHSVRSQVQADFDNYISMARAVLVRNLPAIRSINSGNQFVSGLGTNFYLSYVETDYIPELILKFFPRKYDNCFCYNFHGCPRPVLIRTRQNQSVEIPGMISDCLIVDATLASTLECYYNLTCFSLLHEEINTNVTLLVSSSDDHFLTNATLQMLINEAMVDSWTNEILFDSFYTQCNPTYCSYSYTKRFSIIFILSTLMGIYSGASFILRILAPVIEKLIFRRRLQKSSSNALSMTDVTIRQPARKLVVIMSRNYTFVNICNIVNMSINVGIAFYM